MSMVQVQPTGEQFPVREGESVFAAAYRAGVEWPTDCFGQARCTKCHVRIVEGLEHQSPVADNEARIIRILAERRYGGDATGVRLACQLTPIGPMALELGGPR
jgi:ferredoxin